MSWIFTILSAVICGFWIGGVTSYAMRSSNKGRKDIRRRATRVTVIGIAIVLCNFFFGIWNGVVALILTYIVNSIVGSQNMREPRQVKADPKSVDEKSSKDLLDKYDFLFDADGKALKDNKDIKLYATTLDGVAYRAVEDLHNNHHIKVANDRIAVLTNTIAQFCIIILVRNLAAKQKSKEQADEVANAILKNLAKVWAKSPENEKRMYELLERDTKDALAKYGDLPLSNKSDSQAGTLLWEYGKFLAQTAGQHPRDLEAVLSCVAVITDANDKMKDCADNVISTLK